MKHKQEAAGLSSGSSPTAIAVSWLRATYEKGEEDLVIAGSLFFLPEDQLT